MARLLFAETENIPMIGPAPDDPLSDEQHSAPAFSPPDLPLPASASGTGNLVAVGTMWLLLQTLGNKALTLLGQLGLASLLSREDFGQIAMAYTVTAFVALLINPGIDVILVRRGRRFDIWSTPAFYFSLFTSAVGCLLILAAAPIAAWTYGVPRLTGLLAVLALSTPIGSLMMIPTAKLRAQMRFKVLAQINFIQLATQTALTLAFAATGFGVYSFVLPVPITYAVVSVLLWTAARPSIRFERGWRHWKYLIGDSSYIFGTAVLVTLVGQADYTVLGLMYGDIVLGPYYFAFSIAVQAIRLTSGSLQLVLMAGLARMPAFSHQQTQAALRATKAIALCGVPLCMIQAVVASPLLHWLHWLYGEKWDSAIPLIQWISVGMAFDVMSWPVGSLLQSRGQFRFLFLWSSCFAPIFIAMISFAAWLGEARGVAMAVCAYYCLFSPFLSVVVYRSSGVSWNELLNMFFRPVLVGVLAGGSSLLALHISAAGGAPYIIQFGASLVAGLLAMAIAARLLMPPSFSEIVERLVQVLPAQLLMRNRTA